MSKDVNRAQVLKTTKVRTALKNDGSWIHKSTPGKEQQDKARTESAAETRPVLEKKSFVSSAAKIFESSASKDSPLNPPLKKTHVSSEGDTTRKGHVTARVGESDKTGQAQHEKLDPKTAVEQKEGAAPGTSSMASAENSKEPAKDPGPNEIELKTKEKPSHVTVPAKSNHAVAQPVKESCKTNTLKPNEANTAEAEAKVKANSPETPALKNTKTVGKDVLQSSVEPTPDTGSKSLTLSEPQAKDPDEQTSASAVTDKKNNSAAVAAQAAVKLQPRELPTSKTPVKLDKAEAKATVSPAEHKDPAAGTSQVGVELKPEEPTKSKSVNATSLDHAELKSSTIPPKQDAAKTVEAKVANPASQPPNQSPKADVTDLDVGTVTDMGKNKDPAAVSPLVAVDLKPEKPPAVKETGNATSLDHALIKSSPQENFSPAKATTPQGKKPVSDTLSKPPTKKTVEPVAGTGSPPAPDKLPDRAIDLTDALDELPSAAESAPKPGIDPKPSKLNQCDESKNTIQKPKEEPQSPYTLKKTRDGKAVCSFCDQVINGNVKITISDPHLTCHSECLKCALCAKDLGDLLTPMFLHNQMFHCKGCFTNALRT